MKLRLDLDRAQNLWERRQKSPEGDKHDVTVSRSAHMNSNTPFFHSIHDVVTVRLEHDVLASRVLQQLSHDHVYEVQTEADG